MKARLAVVTVFATLVLFTGVAYATSPMPEEVKPGLTVIVCTIHIVSIKDHEGGIPEGQTAKFAFEASEAKRDVLEWVTSYINNKLNERNVSEFKVECKFPK